jgi:hypothetical protein
LRQVIENWIFLSSKTELDSELIQPFWERLSMFLAVNVGECPEIVFTANNDLWKRKYEGTRSRAFYNEDIAKIIFWSPSYIRRRKLITNNLSEKLKIVAEENNYKYIIPVNDIYHEMIHHVQFVLGDWLYDDLLEGSAEITTFLMTGDDIISENGFNEYVHEEIALWNIGRKLLKLKPWEFYIFIRDCIVDPNFHKEYFSDDSNFVKILASEYGGSVDRLLNTMTKKMGKINLYKPMLKDLKFIYNRLVKNEKNI